MNEVKKMSENPPKKVALLVKLEPEVHKQFKMLCVEKDIYMSDVAEEQIVKWIRQEQKKKKEKEK